jgi:hypothetical protein
MIRPFTFVCFLLAGGSGLYLYSAKHSVQVVDREIEKTVHATAELREQIRVLHAEWTLQNDPQRLQALADQLLNLKTVTPSQFTSMADLDKRLPPVPSPEPPPTSEPAEPEQTPVAQASPPEVTQPAPVAAPAPPPRPAASAAASVPAPPPRPVPAVAAAAPPPRPPEHEQPRLTEREQQRPAEREHKAAPRPVVAEAPPERTQPVVAHRTVVAESRQPAPPAPTTASGSALGMARSVSVPPPRPIPANASQWVGNGGGGGG